jgi:hypothetical protein
MNVNSFLENLKAEPLSEIDWSKLTDWEYLTYRFPPKDIAYFEWVVLFVGLSLIGIVIARFVVFPRMNIAKPMVDLSNKLSVWWFANSAVLLLLLFFRAQGITFLNMRLLLVISALVYVLIGLYKLVYLFAFMPARIERYKQAVLKDKYRPKKKNR